MVASKGARGKVGEYRQAGEPGGERPKVCECGGTLVYTRDFGRWFVYCDSCTPVATIRAARRTHDKGET